MRKARYAGVLLLGLLSGGAASAIAQEVVLTNGSRLRGTVEKYENGFAYVRIIKDGGKTFLSMLPEDAVDKAATESARSSEAGVSEAAATAERRSGPFKLPHNDLERERPDIVAVAEEERARRESARDSGAASGRVFRNGERGSGIPTPTQVLQLADLRGQPSAGGDGDLAAGMDFYEVRLEILSEAFGLLGVEWEDMWRHCSPVTYRYGPDGVARTAADRSPPDNVLRDRTTYRQLVLDSYRDENAVAKDRWPASCVRRDSDYLARGRRVLEAYGTVYAAYLTFADHSGQAATMVPRQLPGPRS